ncbi:MAG: glycosyltransferase [Weeksellaceae bacterium]|nr:glycosyltransferase [Weeksellaceae bacterium]
MKTRVLAFVTNNIATDQRLQKVGNSLQTAGYDFELVGTNSQGLPELHCGFRTQRFRQIFQRGFLFYAENNIRIFFFLLFRNLKNTILLSNDLDTLLPLYIISKLRNKPLVFDSHEIFSKLPSLSPGSVQEKFWTWLEKRLVPNVKHFYTVSEGYANWFEENYKNRPVIIRNVPVAETQQLKENASTTSINVPKILLYQGALNANRGLERMILAMEHLPEYVLWIVGSGPKEADLKNLTHQQKYPERIIFHGYKSPLELKKLTKKAHIGLSLEEANNISYKLALPNKIFDYIHANLPIVGTHELPEVANIIQTYKLGSVVNSRDVQELVRCVKETEQMEFNRANFHNAQQEFNWKNQEEKLLRVFAAASSDKHS